MRAAPLVVVLAWASAARSEPPPPPDPRAMVDIAGVIPDVVVDIRYATAANFTGAVLYPVARCKLRRAVADRLARAAAALRAEDRRLVVWDCYRPSSVQAELWKRRPDPRYVARPSDGSRHSRGAAVDVALADHDGQLVDLPTGFDEFSAAAHRDRALRGDHGREARRLDAAMTAAGFIGLTTEWWHYDAPDSGKFSMSDEPL